MTSQPHRPFDVQTDDVGIRLASPLFLWSTPRTNPQVGNDSAPVCEHTWAVGPLPHSLLHTQPADGILTFIACGPLLLAVKLPDPPEAAMPTPGSSTWCQVAAALGSLLSSDHTKGFALTWRIGGSASSLAAL